MTNNLYHFSLLYMFARSEFVSKDYFTLLYSFLEIFPQGTWNYPIEGTDPLILTDQMNHLLAMSKIHSSDLSEAQMKILGFSEWIDLVHSDLTLEEITKLRSRPTSGKMKKLGFKGNIAKYAAIYMTYVSDDMEQLMQYHGSLDFEKKLEDIKISLYFKLMSRVREIPGKIDDVKVQLEKLPKIEGRIDALVKIIDESDS